jgi:RNA polymerase sigma-70 factor (family 1)
MLKLRLGIANMKSYSRYSDEELIDLLKKSDQIAFAEIYQRYRFLLYAHAYKKLGNREESRDVVQEVFTMLWTKREKLSFNATFRGYMYTVVRNRILNIFNHQEVKSNYISSMDDFQHNGYTPADEQVRTRQLSEIIEAEINALPPKMKQVFLLSRRDHLSHKEIAGELSISEKTVDRQISNSLKILKARLGLVAFISMLMNF